MEFEHQKPVTAQYRENWERIYAQQKERKEKRSNCPDIYPNGCPILEERDA